MTEKLSILIIDDNEDDRAFYCRALKKNTSIAYDILESEDSDSGLALLDTHTPACVLLDYSLPGRNGIEVLKRIRAQHAFLPVVMLTGQGNEEIAVRAMQEGAQNYIAKSNVAPDTILRIIQVAVEHCALEKQMYEQHTLLENFTRTLAHDLTEPVRTIKSFLNLMTSRETLSTNEQGYFTHIQKAAQQMDTIVGTLPKEIQKAPLRDGARKDFVSGLATVLLVENSEADVELTRILLLEKSHLQCNFLSVNDGQEALETLRAAIRRMDRVDLVLLDINMPGIDGFELLERMRAEDALRTIPVVMYSSSTYHKDMERAKSLGAAGYIIKPAEIHKLKPIIDNLSGIRLRQENDGYLLFRAA